MAAVTAEREFVFVSSPMSKSASSRRPEMAREFYSSTLSKLRPRRSVQITASSRAKRRSGIGSLIPVHIRTFVMRVGGRGGLWTAVILPLWPSIAVVAAGIRVIVWSADADRSTCGVGALTKARRARECECAANACRKKFDQRMHRFSSLFPLFGFNAQVLKRSHGPLSRRSLSRIGANLVEIAHTAWRAWLDAREDTHGWKRMPRPRSRSLSLFGSLPCLKVRRERDRASLERSVMTVLTDRRCGCFASTRGKPERVRDR
jgi:hypothetical protein